MWFRWPVHADLYVTRSEARLIGKTASFSAPVQDGIAAAIAVLAKRAPKLSQATVWLGGDLVRYGVLAPVQGRLSDEDVRKLVLAELDAKSFDPPATLAATTSAPTQWRVALHRPDSAGRRVWAVMDSGVEAVVRAVLDLEGLKLNGLAPLLARLLVSDAPDAPEAPEKRVDANQTSMKLLLEAQTVTAIQSDQAGITSIRQIESDAAETGAVLERLQVQTGIPLAQMQLVSLVDHRSQQQKDKSGIAALKALGVDTVTAGALPAAWLRERSS